MVQDFWTTSAFKLGGATEAISADSLKISVGIPVYDIGA